MIFRLIPQFTVDDNAKYEVKTEGTKGTYAITVVIDECNDNKIVLKNTLPEGQEYKEYTNCTCPGFRNKKVITCKHIRAFISYLRASGVEIDTEGCNVSE